MNSASAAGSNTPKLPSVSMTSSAVQQLQTQADSGGIQTEASNQDSSMSCSRSHPGISLPLQQLSDTSMSSKDKEGSTLAVDRAAVRFGAVPSMTGGSGAMSARQSKSGGKKQKKSMIGRILPSNLKQEKRRFFDSKFSVSPQFQYDSPVPENRVKSVHSTTDNLLPQALNILQSVRRKYGGYTGFMERTGGAIMTHSQVVSFWTSYLTSQGLSSTVNIKFRKHMAAPTMVSGKTVIMRFPTNYRIHRMKGTADHEVGTHLLRRLNEAQQPWFKRQEEFGMQRSLVTEEGLACLNTYLERGEKLMFRAAMSYYSVCMAEKNSFVGVWNALTPYLDDVEARWEACFRCKRGLADTSQAGAFSKDQVYLGGCDMLLKARESIDFTDLYLGKVSLEDIDTAREHGRKQGILLPKFLADGPSRSSYLKNLDAIAAVNGLG